MKLLFVSLLSVHLTALTLLGQTEGDPYKNPPSTPAPPPASEPFANVLSFEEEVISLPILDAFKLLREKTSDPERYEAAVKLVDAGKAKVERLVTVRCKSGQRTVYESVVEFRYPVGFSVSGEAGKGGDPAKNEAAGATPTSFETLNIGDSVELQAVLGPDGQTVEVEIIPSKRRFLSDRKFAENVEQPIFNSQKIQTSATLRVGIPFLLGTLNPPYDDGYANNKEQRIWLDFIKFQKVKDGSAEAAGTTPPPPPTKFVTVGGEVKAPQRVPFTPDLTLSAAIQSAGGFTEFASKKNVIWISEGKRATVDMKIIMTNPSQDILLKPGDQIMVQSSPF